MPLRLDIKKKLSAKSDRVKSVDIHPTEPWALAALYSGNVMIWDYETATVVKSFELSELPVRCAKFIARKQWFIAASDDMKLRAYNYNTMEKVKEVEAHQDYIRFLEVHPSLPYILSCSDDMTVKLWDWNQDFECTQYFEGHQHYVMQIKFNPKDSNTFASGSLDRSIKVWGLGSPVAHYTLEGHERGVNCIDYYPSGDKPYILSGADDRTVKIWDYQTKSIVHSFDGHSHNVCAVLFHPKLPLIASASEDGTVRLWSSTTYRAESTLNYGMERAWALAATEESNMLACGFDEGCVVVELGNDDPVASMDNTGKVIFAKNNEIQSANVRGLASSSGDEEALPDGERLPVIPRDLGACELYPQMLKHNCNGRFVAVCGDGEFIIYTALNLRNKAFGQALDFAWSGTGTGDYCIRESISRIKFFKNFKESNSIRPATSSAEGLFGGHCVGVKGGDGSILFYDWESGTFIRKIDVDAKEVYWSDSGNMVCIATEDSAYVLSYDAQATAAAVAMGEVNDEVGIEGTFDLLYEISDTVTSGKWVGDCFIFLNNGGRLNYIVGGQVQTLVHLETSAGGVSKHSVLGYLAKEDRVYLVDKSLNITSYSVMLSVLEYQTAVMRGDFDAANELLATIPESQYTTVARFLESQGFKEEAMAVTTDPDHKFDLALELDHVDIAHSLMQETPEEDKDATDTMTKWKKLSDAALKASNFDLCESASQASNDYAGLLLMYSAIGNYVGLENLAKSAEADGKTNIAFSAYLLTGNVEACAEILISTNRLPEAAFFARTYLPSRVDEIVAMWKADLSKVSESAAAALISPSMDKESFPDFDVGLQVEQMFMDQRASNKEDGIPATDYLSAKDDLDLDLVDLVKSRSQAAEPVAPPPAESPEMEDDNGEEKVPDEETDIVDSDTIEADEAMKAQLEALAAEQALQDQITLEMEARAAEEARMQAEAAAVEVDETEETTEVETEEIADAPVDVENKDTMNDFGDDW
jgi:coatomer subunit beta'